MMGGGGGGPNRRNSVGMGFGMRPTPYDRGDRFGGMNRFSSNGMNFNFPNCSNISQKYV